MLTPDDIRDSQRQEGVFIILSTAEYLVTAGFFEYLTLMQVMPF